MFEFLRASLIKALLLMLPGLSFATEAVPVPTGALPASFFGVLPCANCEGIETRLTLREDNTYFMTQLYVGMPGANKSRDLGRWVTSHFGNVIVLKGQDRQTRYFRINSPAELTLLDLEARTIFSELNYSLARSTAVEQMDLKIFPLNGMYRYQADAGMFLECVSGIEFPVAQTGQNAKLEASYLENRKGPSQPLYASVYGHIKPTLNMEGTATVASVHPLRFESISTDTHCDTRLTSASFRDQVWNLVQLNGKPIVLPASGQMPRLTFHSENSRLSGSAGCNQLLGTYTATSNQLQTALVAATRMACPHTGNLEGELINTLTQVKTWNILGQRLELYGQLGNLLARFEAGS